jgi:hypothetical protein
MLLTPGFSYGSSFPWALEPFENGRCCKYFGRKFCLHLQGLIVFISLCMGWLCGSYMWEQMPRLRQYGRWAGNRLRPTKATSTPRRCLTEGSTQLNISSSHLLDKFVPLLTNAMPSSQSLSKHSLNPNKFFVNFKAATREPINHLW